MKNCFEVFILSAFWKMSVRRSISKKKFKPRILLAWAENYFVCNWFRVLQLIIHSSTVYRVTVDLRYYIENETDPVVSPR